VLRAAWDAAHVRWCGRTCAKESPGCNQWGGDEQELRQVVIAVRNFDRQATDARRPVHLDLTAAQAAALNDAALHLLEEIEANGPASVFMTGVEANALDNARTALAAARTRARRPA
jgi:hypothetical protein